VQEGAMRLGAIRAERSSRDKHGLPAFFKPCARATGALVEAGGHTARRGDDLVFLLVPLPFYSLSMPW
jgi:hypothetical protein